MTLTTQEPVYVIGHLNPDTDAICAAIGYAEYLRVAEGKDAIALRCGSVPSRVKWVLEQAGIEAPKLVTDIRTTAELISDKCTATVSEGDTFLKVYDAMKKSGMESLPVVSDDGDILGILNFTQLMQLLMPQDADGSWSVKTVFVSPQKILESLQGVSVGAEVTSAEEKLIMFVGASSEESTKNGLIRDAALGLSKMQLVICGNRKQLQKVAIEMEVRMMVVTGGFDVDPEMITLAREKGVKIICCKHDTATTVQLIRCSRMVDTALGGEFLCVDADEAVSDLRRKLSLAKQEIFPVLKKGTRKLIGVFTKAELVAPPVTKIVMVDHNEYSQAVRGIEEAQVVEVIDHHRLGGNVVSRDPIRFLNEPVGSSSTLVARKFKDRNTPISKGVALCLIAGLISDTLNLTSPTTTDVDTGILKWLCEIADVDAKQFTQDFFASGSLLSMGTASELINTDRKEFEESGKTISITQIEEVKMDGFNERKDEIEVELEKLCKYKGYDLAIAAVTDISEHYSLLIVKGDERIIKELPFEHRNDGVIMAKGVVSRKKQILPAVCQAICSARATLIE